METILFSACTKSILKDIFGLKQRWESPILNTWLERAQSMMLEDYEVKMLQTLQKTLIRRCDDWNEAELNEYFIGPIIALVNFNTEYFCVFSERPIEAEIGEYKLTGKPDLMVAQGESSPKIPYFCFSEYKKQIAPDGNPVYQALGEMLAARELNPSAPYPVYGVGVMGKQWQFIVLQGQDYCVSKSFSTDDEEIVDVVKTLKALKEILLDIAKSNG
jgi:hypothetical protein